VAGETTSVGTRLETLKSETCKLRSDCCAITEEESQGFCVWVE